MRHPKRSVGLLAFLLLATAPLAGLDDSGRSTRWPSFRGERAQGIADDQGLPLSWDPNRGEDVLWSVEVEGLGHSSPVVWDGTVYLTTAVLERATDRPQPRLGDTGGIDMAAVEEPHRWLVLAFDAASGERAWATEVARGIPRAPHHVKASQANATPATDGAVVVAALGSEGLFALDARTGAQRWRVDTTRPSSAAPPSTRCSRRPKGSSHRSLRLRMLPRATRKGPPTRRPSRAFASSIRGSTLCSTCAAGSMR